MTGYKYLSETGVIVADTQDILNDVVQEYKGAFGDALDVDASTPQGTIIQSETVARASVMKRNADLANMMNPNYAYDAYLDAIGIFTGQERGKDIPTYGLGAILVGDNGTAIRAGTAFTTAVGDTYVLAQDVEIEINRQTSCVISSVEFGPVPLAIGRLEPVSAPPGLDYVEVTAATSVQLGSKKLSNAKMKTLRNQTLFAMGIANSGAIFGRLLKLPNVRSVNVLENIDPAPAVVNGVTIPSGSIWVCVSGSQDQQSIIDSLWSARQGTCSYSSGNKGTPKTGFAKDPYSGVKYSVSYAVAEELDVHVRFEAERRNSASSEISVQKTIMKYANGEIEGEAGFEIGLNISSYEIGGAVSKEHPALYSKKCTVALMPKGVPPVDSDFKAEQVVAAWQIGILKEGNINVVIYQ